LDVKTDPNVPPLPPHITFEQAQGYLSSIMKGDPDALAYVGHTTREVVRSWLPTRE
jgi:pyruvate dehydrogenase (quinone)